ncbi:DUF4349 domain-containing protein [Aureibaculum conchae]|uniref:DUF4349 domain-containing protein n=1 Tax=Aureibaculum sp. 2308TA14-22 TaxID=3108392 RepID=UPI0033940FBB
MKLKYIPTFLFFIGLLVGCKSDESSESFEIQGKYDTAEEVSVKNDQPIQVQRKLIKEGNVRFETDDLKATKANTLAVVQKYNAYVSSDQEYKSTTELSNTIIIRVPADNFDTLLNEITKGVTQFDNKEIRVKDVTEEFLDVEARLKTKKELETRYLELLKKANTVNEVLEVEKEIGQLRTDIESIEGRLNYLKNQVSLSTLTLTFYETTTLGNEFGRKFKDGFKNGWDNLIWFFVFLTNIWPFIILFIAIIFLIKYLRKRKKQQ